MHYYRFNIGDYKSHTSHLDPLEDIAYRRMLDYCYLNEIGLPESLEEIGRLISMRTHCDCIANVLREFFYIENCVYKNKRVEIDLHDFKSKSEKAASSAKEKWRKHRLSCAANAERTQCENDANAMLTNNHKPLTINQEPLLPLSSGDDASHPEKIIIPYMDIFDLFNQKCISLPNVMIKDAKRKSVIKSIWLMDARHQSIDFFNWFFGEVEKSDFLTGRKTEWKASFDWVLKPANFKKIIEGNYDGK